MIRSAKNLSPDQKIAIESILGRELRENEDISVRAIEPPDLTDERRSEVVKGLEEYFAKVDAQRQPVSPEEADAAIDEALRSVRADAVRRMLEFGKKPHLNLGESITRRLLHS